MRSTRTVQSSAWTVKSLHQTPSMQPGCEPARIRSYTRESGATGPPRLTGGQRRQRGVSLPEMAPATPTWAPHVTCKPLNEPFRLPLLCHLRRSDICVHTGQGARPIVRFGATSASVLCVCKNVRQSADHVTPQHIFFPCHDSRAVIVFLALTDGDKLPLYQLQLPIFTPCTMSAREISR